MKERKLFIGVKAYDACLVAFRSSGNIDETVGGSRDVRSGEVSGECTLRGRILRALGLIEHGPCIPVECLDMSSSASRS